MAASEKSRWRRVMGRLFRWLRLGVLLAILSLLTATVYFDYVGLPDFLKRPLLSKLREQGLEAEFTRMRLRWHRGFIFDELTLTTADQKDGLRFSASEAVFRIRHLPLLRKEVQLDSLLLENGRLEIPVPESESRILSVHSIRTLFALKDDDRLELHYFESEFHSARIKIEGSLENASAIRDWEIFRPRPEPRRGLRDALKRFAETLQKIRFDEPPELTLVVEGDAREFEALQSRARFVLPSARTPWGAVKQLELGGWLVPYTPGDEAKPVELSVTCEQFETDWTSGSDLRGRITFLALQPDGGIDADLDLSAATVRTRWASAAQVRIAAAATHSQTNLMPVQLSGTIQAENVQTPWGSAEGAALSGGFHRRNDAEEPEAGLAWWGGLFPFVASGEAELRGVESDRLAVDRLRCAVDWRAPDLVVRELQARLYEGDLAAEAGLNVSTREGLAKMTFDFDALQAAPLLTAAGRRWLGQFAWEQPPEVRGEARVRLPAWTTWTDGGPDWRGEVKPALVLQGEFVSENGGAFRGIPVTAARSEFTYSNMVWTLPHLTAARPEGGFEMNFTGNEVTREYRFLIHSRIDPRAILPVLETEEQRRALDYIQFSEPPHIRAEVTGRWNARETVVADAEVAVTNFVFRGSDADSLTAMVRYTNQFVRATEVRIKREDKYLRADLAEFDIASNVISLTNVTSTIDPHLVTRAIGPQTARAIAPYQFAEPPRVRLNGRLSPHEIEKADLHFLVSAEQFAWGKVKADKVEGDVIWKGQSLRLDNVQALTWRGSAFGWASFDFTPEIGNDFQLDVTAREIDLRSAVTNLNSKSSLEGILDGRLVLTAANTENLEAYAGYGYLHVRDGLIWDIPVFGIFSPVLNAIAPGLGNSRAHEATATFTVDDGRIHSDDLQIRALQVRLHYRGVIDAEQRIDARVEAELLRDTWIIGRALSLVLTPLSKMFEYKITGPLNDPRSEPVYIPNFLMKLFRPIKTLKQLLPDLPPLEQEQSP